MRVSSGASRAHHGLFQPFVRRSLDLLAKGVVTLAGSLAGDAKAQRARIDPPRVLVVDDDPVNLIVATELLATCGIPPLTASDGAQAVAIAGRLQLDLILMDLQMPVLDGYGATRQIRCLERQLSRPRVPVMAFTSIEASEVVLGSSGIDGMLKKPCDRRALHECLARWCPALVDPSR